jgi:hypothetical protein
MNALAPCPDDPQAEPVAALAETPCCNPADLNRSCFCITLDRAQLAAEMEKASGDPAFYATHIVTRPHLFSSVPVFLPESDRDAMLAIVHAIETLAHTPRWSEAVLGWAPKASHNHSGPSAVFMGYDFHLGDGPPRLIEINTNAGGAFLNAFAARAQLACCSDARLLRTGTAADFDRKVIGMFECEWRRRRGVGRPAVIAIVDDNPPGQYLYPEFLLAQRLFQAHGIETIIVAPEDLAYDGFKLRAPGQVQGREIDLVYNRLTDFALDHPNHAALREAWLDDAVVVTPNPHNHALWADKRNLTVLTDAERLRAWGLSADVMDALSTIPRAVAVCHHNADDLWSRRKELFFKPVAGYGGKAVYRGDKLTRSTWAEILASGYIAQEIARPSERMVLIDGQPQARKMDVRLYTYDGELLLAAARLYQGQTTNFRTEGGGFAPVHFLPHPLGLTSA